MSAILTVDLPFPVSVNRVWRSGNKRVFRSPQYMAWLKEAHGCWLQQRSQYKTWGLRGYYAVTITLCPPDNRHRDLGNFEKVCSDFAQAAGIIENDRFCRRLVIEYGSKVEAPLGARLVFQSVAMKE